MYNKLISYFYMKYQVSSILGYIINLCKQLLHHVFFQAGLPIFLFFLSSCATDHEALNRYNKSIDNGIAFEKSGMHDEAFTLYNAIERGLPTEKCDGKIKVKESSDQIVYTLPSNKFRSVYGEAQVDLIFSAVKPRTGMILNTSVFIDLYYPIRHIHHFSDRLIVNILSKGKQCVFEAINIMHQTNDHPGGYSVYRSTRLKYVFKLTPEELKEISNQDQLVITLYKNSDYLRKNLVSVLSSISDNILAIKNFYITAYQSN